MSDELYPRAPLADVPARFDVIAFDFDGTLADTTAAILTTALQTLEALSHPPVERELWRPTIGLPLRQAFLGVGVPETAADACVLHYRERFLGNAREVALYPAVRECLEQLGALGLTLGVVSSRGRSSLGPLLDQLGIRDHFREVLAEEDVPGKKPAPDLVLELAARLGVRPERILVVGDTTYDIEMGHAAGAATCAVTYGNHDAQRLSGVRPTYQLDSLSTLANLLGPRVEPSTSVPPP
ncbi:MAG TPA: HAD family hydrolase [Polyangiales bacterium]